MKQDDKPVIEIKNRRASFEYRFLQTFEAGIMLTGTEIKSVRKGSANLTDAYCVFKRGELFVRGLFIAEYELGTAYNHDPRRVRKLLLRGYAVRALVRNKVRRGVRVCGARAARRGVSRQALCGVRRGASALAGLGACAACL